jgi:hypothetical protein
VVSLNEHIHRVQNEKDEYNRTLAIVRETGAKAMSLSANDFGHNEGDDPVSIVPQRSPSREVAETLQDAGRRIVCNYVKEMFDKSDPTLEFTVDNVYVVSFAKTLQNHKMMISTTIPDGKYYEVTYNGDKAEYYLDVYVRVDNKRIDWTR